MNKKGQLSLDTVKVVMVTFLILAVIAVALFLGLSSLKTTAEDIDKDTTSFLNHTDQTVTVVNETGSFLPGASDLLRNCQASVTLVQNGTGGAICDSGNYTVTGCKIAYSSGGNTYCNNSLWNVTGSYRYSSERSAMITGNISNATTGFFSNTGTIFSILVVVVIILAISIIIMAVQKFGGRSSGL